MIPLFTVTASLLTCPAVPPLLSTTLPAIARSAINTPRWVALGLVRLGWIGLGSVGLCWNFCFLNFLLTHTSTTVNTHRRQFLRHQICIHSHCSTCQFHSRVPFESNLKAAMSLLARFAVSQFPDTVPATTTEPSRPIATPLA